MSAKIEAVEHLHAVFFSANCKTALTSNQIVESHVYFDVIYVAWLSVNNILFKLLYIYSRPSLSRSRRDPLKHFEICLLRHIRYAELRKIPIEQLNFTNEHVI